MSIEIKEEGYKRKLETIKEKVEQIENQSRDPIVPYPPHGISHSEKLEELLDVLFPGEESDKVNEVFGDREKFLLFAAIWLHDVGMYPQLFPDDPNPSTWSREDLEEWDREVLRKTHHERSERYILKNWENLGLEEGEAEILALICKYHRKSQKIPEYIDEKIRLVIAYLRLLDALHIPDRPSRERLRRLKTYLAYGMDPVSKFHWYKSFYVPKDGIKPFPNELKLVIKFILPEEWNKIRNTCCNGKEKMSPLVRAVVTDVKDELDAVKDILVESKVKYGLPAYIYVEPDFELRSLLPERIDELEQLLAIIELFDPAIAPNSAELINTVLDGLERCIIVNNPDFTIEALRAYQRDILEPLLEYRPCHVYLRKVHDYLKKEFQSHSEMSSVDKEKFVKEVNIMVKALKEKRKKLKDELPKKILETLRINDNDVILVYGYSSSVVTVLGALKDDIKENIEIIVCECSTKTKHRYDNKLLYCDGIKYFRELKAIGIKNVYYTPDLCASNLFSRGKFNIERGREEEPPKKVTKVFFGANGIDKRTGEVAHGLGHLAIADMATAYKIPIYVIAESMKIGELKLNPKSQRKDPWYPTDILFDEINERNSYNPREDVVSPKGRELYIMTEKGSAPPNMLKDISSEIEEIVENYKIEHRL